MTNQHILTSRSLLKKLLTGLTEKSNRIFKGLCNKRLITKNELKYFSYSFKNACCLDKMYLLLKIDKRLFDVPGHPLISNCGAPREKVSEFLKPYLQPIMKGVGSYVRDEGDFLEKRKHLGKVPSNVILVIADAVGLYPSIPDEASLKAPYGKLEERVE